MPLSACCVWHTFWCADINVHSWFLSSSVLLVGCRSTAWSWLFVSVFAAYLEAKPYEAESVATTANFWHNWIQIAKSRNTTINPLAIPAFVQRPTPSGLHVFLCQNLQNETSPQDDFPIQNRRVLRVLKTSLLILLLFHLSFLYGTEVEGWKGPASWATNDVSVKCTSDTRIVIICHQERLWRCTT
jgi:hypothetical protein